MRHAKHGVNTERLRQLNIIKQFLYSPQPLMLIVGEKDSGKTKLLTDIMLQMRASRNVVRLQATPNLRPSQLIIAVSKHWALDHNDDEERIENQLEKMLAGLATQQQSGLLIIDDAHLLSLSMLAAISHLVTQQEKEQTHLHILLTGRPLITEKMNTLQTKEVPHLTVGALTREEAFRKIKNMIDRSGLKLPFATANAIFTKLYERSEGMPNTLENMIRELITQQAAAEIVTIKPTPTTAQRNKLWEAHGIKLIAIPALIVSFYLFYGWQEHQRHLPISHVVERAEPTITLPPPRQMMMTIKPAPYTLQLISSPHQQTMTDYLKQHPLKNTQLMKTQRKGQAWYVL
ncbi:MAG: AAA family ATPase, partial [Coxiellaceae bacterium]|nr:AAA family ATPase [Coxiellaceae bacterium]